MSMNEDQLSQTRYEALHTRLKDLKLQFAEAILQEAKSHGFTLQDPIHRAAIMQLAKIDFELVLAMLPTEIKGKVTYPF